MVDDDEKTITITAEIDIWGDQASDEIAQRIETAIEQEWSGQTYTDPDTGTTYGVVIDVNVRNVVTKRNASAPNQIRIDADPHRSRSFVRTFGRVDTGIWKADAHSKALAHEFGHLMGLPDDYDRRTNKPNEGHFGHLMAGGPQYLDWRIDAHEVRDVVGRPLSIFRRKGKTTFRLR